jgi:hypothetical protein
MSCYKHLVFSQLARNIEEQLKSCASYLVWSQICLNLPRDDCHFGCMKKFIIKNHWVPFSSNGICKLYTRIYAKQDNNNNNMSEDFCETQEVTKSELTNLM